MKKKIRIIILAIILITVILVPMAGLQYSVVAEESDGVEYEYDELNRIIRAVYPDGTVVTYQYDANGNITDTKIIPPGQAEVTESPEPTKENETSESNAETSGETTEWNDITFGHDTSTSIEWQTSSDPSHNGETKINNNATGEMGIDLQRNSTGVTESKETQMEEIESEASKDEEREREAESRTKWGWGVGILATIAVAGGTLWYVQRRKIDGK